MRAAVDGQAAGAANTFTAVRGESERLFALLDVAFVDVVQQLKDGHLLDGVIDIDRLEVSFGFRARLTPDL